MPVYNVLIQSSINSFGAVVIAGNSAAVSLENMTVLFTPFIYVWFMFP